MLLSGDLASRAALGRGRQRSLWEGTFERSQVCLGIIAEDTQTLKKKIAVEPRKTPRSWSGELGGRKGMEKRGRERASSLLPSALRILLATLERGCGVRACSAPRWAQLVEGRCFPVARCGQPACSPGIRTHARG